MTHPDEVEIQRFFEQLYPDAEDGWLVLSCPHQTRVTRQGKPALASIWFNLAEATWQKVAHAAAHLAVQQTVYFGVAIQHPTCKPSEFERSKNATAYTVPGLWFDLDLAYGQHAASTLPAKDDEALDFLFSLPAKPSLIVHSGGGMYGYWLFREPYMITNEAEHEAITHLSKRFNHTLTTWGKEQHGWTLDALGDLSRVLRPPGTINFKYGKLVEVLHEGAERYNPSDFDEWLIDLPKPSRIKRDGNAIEGQPDLAAIAEHYGSALEDKSKTELAGPHPVHGSSTGDNFNVNVGKGVWHCWRHGTGGDALALIAVCEGLIECEKASSEALCGDVFKRVVTVANEKFQADITLKTKSSAGPLEKAIEQHGVTKAVADVICETEHFARDASEKLYRYQDGVYKRFGERFIEQRVKVILNQAEMAGKWTTRRSSEIVAYIRVDAPYLPETPSVNVVNLKNGLLEVDTLTLRPHDPAFLSSIQLPIKYDPDVPATEWETFEAQTLPPDCKELMFKLAAWLMLPHKHVQRAVLLLGEGGNGKSTLLNALRAFVGRGNTASVALQKLEADKFSVIRLLGKLVNICPDLPSTYLETTSTFKALTGFNDTIEGERKYIQDSIEFEPYCRLLFSANRPPRSSDDSQGFFDRWLVVPCEAQFRGTEQEKSSDEMAVYLTSPRALSGALNRALDQLPLIRKEGFAATESTQRAFEEFRETTDPLTVWLDRNVIVSPGVHIPKDELVNAYNRECERRNRAGVTKTSFTKSLKRLRPMILEDRATVGGQRIKVYKGLAWKSRRDEEL